MAWLCEAEPRFGIILLFHLGSASHNHAARAGRLLDRYHSLAAPPCHWCLNSDGVVDTADLGILISEFGTPCPVAP